MKNKNLISISGKKGSGKDTVGEIIQKLTTSPYSIHRWADALKEICSIILNVPVSKFEDQEFKASELGEEWWYWNRYNSKIFKSSGSRVPYKGNEHLDNGHNDLFKPTVRWLLQNLGTGVCRNIHANMWVNILMNQYKGVPTNTAYRTIENIYPQWIITDTRFENELQAVQDRNGLCVKVERDNDNNDTHKSETNLDHVKEWDWVFNNNGSIEDLVEQVKEFLTHFKII